MHNGRWGWRRSPSFRALYDLPPCELEALAPHLVDFAFSLSDLRQMRDEELLAKAPARRRVNGARKTKTTRAARTTRRG